MLTVHQAGSGAALAAGLAAVLAVPLPDPFAYEVVAVPAKGVERWLAQRLAHVLGSGADDGVCANVLFPSPARMLEVTAAAVSPEHARSVERWAPAAVTWSLLEVIEADDLLSQNLGHGDDDKGRRFAVVARLARSFDAYGPGVVQGRAGSRAAPVVDGVTAARTPVPQCSAISS